MTDIASSAFSSRSRIIAYWVTTARVVSELALGGVWDILRVPQVRGLIERLGYPLYFLVILGSGNCSALSRWSFRGSPDSRSGPTPVCSST